MKAKSPEAVGFTVRDPRGQEIKLSMQELWLTGQILPVGARLVVRHVFQSAETKPVEVIYAFVLPRDAALRQFRIEGKGFTATSELRPVKKAQEIYEKGVEEGSLSTLARQYGDGLINLAVGNLLPGEQVTVYLEIIAGVDLRDDGYRFRFPFTVAPTYHPKARTVEVRPGVGEMELPEKQFGDLLLPPFHQDAKALHRVGFDLSIVSPTGPVEVKSVSHTLRVGAHESDRTRVSLARESDEPNRDLVLDVTMKKTDPMVFASRDEDGKGQFAAVIPSTAFGKGMSMPRRVVFALDRSGSMEGEAIQQAKMAMKACLATLSPADSFGLVAFDSEVEILDEELIKGDAQGREKADGFLDQIDARGGTELFQALDQGAKILGTEGGDMFVVTDGQVSETESIIAKTKSLGIRVHVLGIGSASQDRFLTLLARDTGGLSRYITAQEGVGIAAVELFASAGTPLATRLSLITEGLGKVIVEPDIQKTVFADAPVILFGETAQAGSGKLIFNWKEPTSGSVETDLVMPKKPTEMAQTLFLLRGSRLITDADAQQTGEGDDSPATRREQKRGKTRLEELSRKYGLASRAMALVAVVKRETDVAGKVPKTMVVPVGMPEGTNFGAYFKAAASRRPLGSGPLFSPSRMGVSCCLAAPSPPPSARLSLRKTVRLAETRPIGTDDLLMELAMRMQPDGGMPGGADEERFAASVLALIFFVGNGHNEQHGAFRTHVCKLIEYLRTSGLIAHLLRVRDTAQNCAQRMEGLERLIQSTATTLPQPMVATLCGQSRQSMGQLADTAEREAGRVEALLSGIRGGNVPPGDHAEMVRELVAKGHVDVGAVWQMLRAAV
ncbi:MAG: VIT and VWA domain-containing protein [Lentisphaerae bacterium]|nr:VIT and VWA domain-containing protein [Lentisphaerota bacterium]